MVSRFQIKMRNVSIIQCYAPTEDAYIEEKIRFYMLLREEKEKNQPKRSSDLNR
jgi:hypothetical protein